MPLIALEQVTKIFNRGQLNETIAVQNVSLAVELRDMAVLKGPSGSGKTSLLSIIGCMTRPTSGKVTIGGKDTAKLPERFLTGIRRKRFGFIFQQFNLIQGMTVRENIMLPLYPTDLPFAAIREKAESIMGRLGIGKRGSYPVQGLSGGEQQRVAIGRALVNDPEIILADEPTSHLDTKLSRDLIQIMLGLQEEGRTIIISTHDPLIYEAAFVKRLIEMRDGKVTGVFTK